MAEQPSDVAASPQPAPSGARPSTCAQCGKRLNRKTQYYRNGRHFCNKRCWHTSSTGAPSPATA